jgi:GNAT superfamily N-acetyltransferase
VSIAVPTIGYQWDTLVRSDHRGHRLGLLMKLANLRQVRERSPQTRFLNTWNAESNAPMVSVNERLGFVVVEAWEEWQLHLGDQVAALA